MIKSNPYSLTRTELARLASEEYVRNFWWFVASIPAFGLIAVAFGEGALRVIGIMALMWPFSIPARSVLSTSKSSRLFTQGCRVEASDEELVFIGEYRDGKRLRYKVDVFRLKTVIRRKGMLIIRTRLPGFLPVREDAFSSEAEMKAFVDMVERGVAKALGE